MEKISEKRVDFIIHAVVMFIHFEIPQALESVSEFL